jgi:hypothetical protein
MKQRNTKIVKHGTQKTRKQRDAKNAQADGMSALQIAPLKNSGMQTTHMAGGGFVFLLLPFQYLVGWGIFNLVISINYKSRNPAMRDPRFNHDLIGKHQIC